MQRFNIFIIFAAILSLGLPGKAAIYQNIHVLQKKNVVKDQRLEITPNFGYTINNKFKKHLSMGGDFIYHLNDNLGLQFSFSKTYGSNTVANDELGSASQVNAVIPDLFMNWTSSLGMTLTPFYGKAIIHEKSLFYYDFYLESGIGLTSVDINVDSSGGLGGDKIKNTSHILPGGVFGLGFRFYMENWFAIRVAIRDIIFAEGSTLKTGGKLQYDGFPTTGIFDNMFMYLGFSFLL